ncbi:MAG TPA: OmpA family protein [Kofleriaceae bacterium]
MRTRVLIALGASLASVAVVHADPRLEAGGYVGIGFLPNNVQLGDSWAPEQVPGTAPLFGVRLAALLLPHIDVTETQLFQVGVEVETDLSLAHTGAMGSRMSYFAPVFGWRAHMLFRYVDTEIPVQPFLLVGGGGETVASESPFMRKESDPMAYYGGGIALPLIDGYSVRIDGRHGFMASRGGNVTSVGELQLGISGTFGFPEKRRPGRPAEPPPEQPVIDETDSDHDGLPDHIDKCPDEKETVNGLNDGDGCPEPDADADGVIGDADKCPGVAEDVDGFQDDDGCPDLDNDGDGIDDVTDKCPNEPETRNGFDDEDGCPDGIPAAVIDTLADASAKVAFKSGSAKVTDATKEALAPVLELVKTKKSIKVVITATPAKKSDAALAKRRADAVKWYLVDQGAAEGRFVTKVAQPNKGIAIQLTVVLE